MISEEDFVHLPFTTDLSEAGVVHLCRTLPRIGGGARITGQSMRRHIAATSAQLALRRYLALQGLDFGVRIPSTFAQHEAPNVKIGRRACTLESFLISTPAQIRDLAANPRLALRAPALVPSDRFAAEESRAGDAFVFALVSATVASPRMGAPGRRRYWVYALPRHGGDREVGRPLGR